MSLTVPLILVDFVSLLRGNENNIIAQSPVFLQVGKLASLIIDDVLQDDP